MFKPMLAPREDPLSYPKFFEELKFPLLVSPKYDGIRCIIKGGVAYSRTMKPIPSLQVQDEFSYLEHFDGELIIGEPTDYGVYNRTQSHVMSEDKPGDVRFYVFDYTHPDYLNTPYCERQEFFYDKPFASNVYTVHQLKVHNLEELFKIESHYLQEGYEGVMMRSVKGRYKNGRGTFKEGLIYKLKRFQDAEGVIVGFDEKHENKNEQQIDELGYSKRSTHQENLVPAGTLGSFRVIYNEDYITVAPGNFNAEQRQMIWDRRDFYTGQILKFRYFNHGIKDKPRFPRAVGFRNVMDI